MSKLQEIKEKLIEKKLIANITNANAVCLTVEEGLYLIEQLEQAQQENAHIKATIDKIDYKDEPSQEELFQAYKEIYKGKPVGFFIEQTESYNKDLESELEQAQAENERLKEAENVKTYWAREGLIKRLSEQNQKLIEGLERIKNSPWWEDFENLPPYYEGLKRIASNTLSEVKGNG